MQYETYSFPCGLRTIHLPSSSAVSYFGFVVNAGTREEQPDQFGMAHFVEHLLFKGTKKRKSWHILNRMETVGGELNAYTTKEETFLYTVCLNEDTDRAIELLFDLTFNSQFPQNEIEKERDVVLDEINSYLDNPSELIFDDFENMVFSKHEIGHHILGDTESLNRLDHSACNDFHKQFYIPSNLIFFSTGKTPFSKIIRSISKHLEGISNTSGNPLHRKAPGIIPAQRVELKKDLHQSHVMIGSRGYHLHHENRMALYLLNNILGGPGMNSRLNVQLREKYGLVYSIESNSTSYSDTGIFSIYFGCDPELKDRCLKLVYKELKRMREESLTSSQLAAAQKQLKGQLGISSEQSENLALGMGKSFLHFNRYDSLQQMHEKIDSIQTKQLLEVANDIWNEERLFQLIYS